MNVQSLFFKLGSLPDEGLAHLFSLNFLPKKIEVEAPERQVTADLLHVDLFVLWVLLDCYVFGHPAGTLEERNEQDKAENTPVEKRPSRGDTKQVVANPNGLLRGVVWLAHDGVKAALLKPVLVLACATNEVGRGKGCVSGFS